MIRAQPNEARQGGERYMLGDVFFDIRGYDAPLPAGEPAACRRFDAARARGAAHELMCQHDAKCLARSAFDRPSFELGGDALPLTYLEGEVRSPLVIAGSLPAFAAAYDRLRVPAQARTGYWAS
jgi:hypothetical protein